MGRPKCFDRNEVLQAAIQVFWKKGYVDTSLADLEKATGVNRSGLYSEFKDKEDLFVQSIIHYCENSPIPSILKNKPLGWANIETFLKVPSTYESNKGCFMNNTIREYGIIPDAVKTAIDKSHQLARTLLLKNLKATQVKKDPEFLISLIMTFSSGIALKLNAVHPSEVEKEIEGFLKMIKSLG